MCVNKSVCGSWRERKWMWGFFLLLLKPDILLSVSGHQSQAQQEVWYENSQPDVQILPNPGRICHLNVAPKIWQMFPNVCWKVQGYNKEYKGFIDLSLICFVFLSRQWKVFKISIHFKHETSQQHFDWLKLILWQTFIYPSAISLCNHLKGFAKYISTSSYFIVPYSFLRSLPPELITTY